MRAPRAKEGTGESAPPSLVRRVSPAESRARARVRAPAHQSKMTYWKSVSSVGAKSQPGPRLTGVSGPSSAGVEMEFHMTAACAADAEENV